MKHDAILILGGGVREGGALPPWSVRRFDLAIQLRTDEPVVCLSAGTTHRPLPLDEAGFPIFESVAGARYLLGRGVSPESVYIESTSWDTIGNAYFSRLLFADPRAWRKLLVITSEFHMPRTKAIFGWVYGMGQIRYELSFEAASDTGLDASMIQARVERERQSLISFREKAGKKIASLEDLHRWIYTEHRAYTSAGRASSDRVHQPEVLESY